MQLQFWGEPASFSDRVKQLYKSFTAAWKSSVVSCVLRYLIVDVLGCCIYRIYSYFSVQYTKNMTVIEVIFVDVSNLGWLEESYSYLLPVVCSYLSVTCTLTFVRVG